MSTKSDEAFEGLVELSNLEDEALPRTLSPRLLLKDRQQQRVSAVRQAISEALLALGYETQRANTIAEKLANPLPTVEGET